MSRAKKEVRPYSIDLRHEIINVYENEPISQRQLAKRFGVALSFIQKLDLLQKFFVVELLVL
ncbi:MAG: hypothetical protein F6J99_11100 [Moorea sp. SIO4G3]|nr:hypothetical protein [Moorena sp. SIO4G3]